MSAIAQQMPLVIATRGELVLLTVGNVVKKMDHETAIKTGAWLWEEARTAKRFAGDRSVAWQLTGTLHNATPDRRPQREKGLRDAEWLRARQINVSSVGATVNLKIGRHTMGFHYDDARKIAIWFRVRGKEARNNAQDRRHWSKIGELDAIQAGESPMAGRQY
jgi:hypothetical protein